MLHITVRQLQVFATVARRLSFARAAEELHLTPPAVSMQVKQLETQLGLAVFERGASEVRLTSAGELFLVHVRKMLASLKEAEDLVARMRRVETGHLSLGMLSTAKYFLPHLLAEFLRERPGVEVNLVEGNRETLIERVQRNEVDLAVMGRPPGELEAGSEAFGIHPLGVVVPPRHPLAKSGRVAPEQLAGESFLIRERGSGARISMESFFRDSHIRPPVLIQMSSNETIKQAVIAGMGVAFLSLHTVSNELEQGSLRLLNVSGLPILRHWHIVHRRAKALSPLAEALRAYLIANGDTFLARHFAKLNKRLPLAATATRKAAAKNRPRPARAPKRT